MILRQLERRPARTGFSVLGLALATAIVMVGNFSFDSVKLMVHTQFARVQQQDVTVTFTEALGQQALYNLNRDPDVRYVEGRRSVAVELHHGSRSHRSALTGLPDGARLQYVINAEQEPVTLPREGVLITDFLAGELDVAPGDRLRVEVLEGRQRTLEIPVTGITREFLGVGAYMRLDRMARVMGEAPLVNQALLNTGPGDNAALYKRLREQPRVAGIMVRQTALDSFYDTLARTFLTFTFFNSLLGGVIAFGVIYNTVRIALAERQRELASLRVLGYTRGEVGHILLGEMAVLIVVAIPLGWWLGHLLSLGLVTALQTELYRVPLVITDRSYGLAASVVLVSAVLSGAMAWRRVRRLNLVEVLKTRD
jgi:putative ABC transport system permease protein